MILITQILVAGSSGDHCSSKAKELAYKVGSLIAESGALLITGGLDGVMEAASRGAKGNGGLVLAIIPFEKRSDANSYSDIVIPTGIGYARDFITALSGDAVIVIEGGAGTLREVAVAYQYGKPIIALRSSGGTAEKIAGTYIDKRETVFVQGADTPEEAVNLALDLSGASRVADGNLSLGAYQITKLRHRVPILD